jgi:hypothetical protein
MGSGDAQRNCSERMNLSFWLVLPTMHHDSGTGRVQPSPDCSLTIH